MKVAKIYFFRYSIDCDELLMVFYETSEFPMVDKVKFDLENNFYSGKSPELS